MIVNPTTDCLLWFSAISLYLPQRTDRFLHWWIYVDRLLLKTLTYTKATNCQCFGWVENRSSFALLPKLEHRLRSYTNKKILWKNTFALASIFLVGFDYFQILKLEAWIVSNWQQVAQLWLHFSVSSASRRLQTRTLLQNSSYGGSSVSYISSLWSNYWWERIFSVLYAFKIHQRFVDPLRKINTSRSSISSNLEKLYWLASLITTRAKPRPLIN